jgi:hypothetical protein
MGDSILGFDGLSGIFAATHWRRAMSMASDRDFAQYLDYLV